MRASSLSDFGSSIEYGFVAGGFGIGLRWRGFLPDRGGLPVLWRIVAWGRLLCHDLLRRGASCRQAQLVQALAVVSESHQGPLALDLIEAAQRELALMTPKTGSTVCRRSL